MQRAASLDDREGGGKNHLAEMKAGINLVYPAEAEISPRRAHAKLIYNGMGAGDNWCRETRIPYRAIIIKAGEAMTASSAHAHPGANIYEGVCVLGSGPSDDSFRSASCWLLLGCAFDTDTPLGTKRAPFLLFFLATISRGCE